MFLHLCSIGLCRLVTEGPEKGEWKKQATMRKGGLEEQGKFSPPVWTVSDLQYSRFMSSWSSFVGPCNLIISLQPHVVLQSSLQILAEFCCLFFILFSHLVFLPFSFHLRKKKRFSKKEKKPKV